MLFGTLSRAVRRPHGHGQIVSLTDGSAVPFAIFDVSLPAGTEPLEKRVSDLLGRYYYLVPPERHLISIEKKTGVDSYLPVYTSKPIDVRSGIIRETFKV